MSSIEHLFPAAETQREAHATLVQIAGRRTGRIPPDLLAAHVLEVYREAEWPVQRAALEALLRRMETARQEGLRVATRPARHRALGLYRTRPKKAPRGPIAARCARSSRCAAAAATARTSCAARSGSASISWWRSMRSRHGQATSSGGCTATVLWSATPSRRR